MAQLLSFLFTTSDFLALISDTLDYNIPQNPHFFIVNNTFWTMFILFFTDFHIVFSTQFPTNYSWNVSMLSLVLLLWQFFTFAHNIRYCYSTKQLLDCFLYLVFNINCSNSCSCVACNMASVSTFKSVFLSQFHVSFSSVIFYIYLTNCPYIVLFFT